MQWKECYSVGVLVLDADHRLLIDFLDRIETAEKTGKSIEPIIQELGRYARDHFEREQDRMKAVDYPGLADHVKEHDEFMKWLDSVLTAYHMAPDARSGLADTVTEYLQDWLESHLLETAMAYKNHLS